MLQLQNKDDDIIFLHEKIKEYNNLITNSNTSNKNNLNQMNGVLADCINRNEEVNLKLDKLLLKLN